MAVIAAVNVVEKFSTDSKGPGTAEKLLEKKIEWPGSLKERLKAISNSRA